MARFWLSRKHDHSSGLCVRRKSAYVEPARAWIQSVTCSLQVVCAYYSTQAAWCHLVNNRLHQPADIWRMTMEFCMLFMICMQKNYKFHYFPDSVYQLNILSGTIGHCTMYILISLSKYLVCVNHVQILGVFFKPAINYIVHL